MMIVTRPLVTDPDQVRTPEQFLVRSANPEWLLLEETCNALAATWSVQDWDAPAQDDQ